MSPPLLVNGRYRIVRPLGEGGMGNVFLASDLARQGRPVALKRIHPSILDAASVAGFKSEFELMSRLRHPNLVEVYDFEVDQATGDRFLTMEYVEGKDLAQHCGAGQPIPVTEAACLMAQICRGVEYIHRRGLIHNDLTAHNVRVTAGLPSICKVMDFGLASKVGPELRQIRGTLQYLAPEILKGEPSGRHSDIYSLGVLLYSMVTGRLPFDGDPAEIVRLATTTSPPAPGSLNPSVPPEIDSLALGMLSREPAGRPPTVDRVLAALSSAGASSLEIDTPATLASYVRGAALVGRGKEMERIVKALETAHGGAPGDGGQRPFLISGESGVGKSRLVEQTRYEAQLRGGTFAAGQCYEGSAAAYHPFVQILREAIPGAAADEALAPLMLPATEAPADASPSAIRADGEQEHRRVVDAAVQAIIAAAAMRPLTICLEDLQWADTASLDLLAHLARNAAGAPGLVLLATYRSEDAESPPLSAALPNLARAVEWDRIELSRLTREDVGSMLADMFGLETVPPAVVDLLMRETEGNPFFVQVAVESLLEDRGGIRAEAEWQAAVEGLGEIPFPASVADAIGRRLARLTPQETRVLEAIAIAERPISEDLLETMLDPGDDALAGGAAGLLRRLLIVREVTPDGALALRATHVRIRDHVYESMDWARRRELHGRLARQLEARMARGDTTVGIEEVAHHFINSADVERALDYAERAGLRAMQLWAHERGVAFLERALELVSPSEPLHRLRLQSHLGEAYRRAHDLPRAIEIHERLIKAARTVGDKEMAWAASARLLDLQWRNGQHEEAQRGAERAITTLKAEGEKRHRADCLLVLANIAANRGRAQEAKTHNEEALALRREIADLEGTAGCLNNLGCLDMLQGCTPEGRALLTESLALWRRIDNPRRIAEVLDNLGIWHQRQGDLDAAIRMGDEALQMAEQLKDRYGIARCQTNLAAYYHQRGRIDKALDAARAAAITAGMLGIDALQCEALDVQGMIERDQGRTDEAIACHERAAAVARRAALPHQEGFALTSLALDRLLPPGGEPQPQEVKTAREILRRAAKVITPLDSQRLRARLEEGFGRCCLASKELDAALQHARRAVEAASAGGLAEYLARAELLTAECLAAADKSDEAAEAARRALSAAEPRGLLETIWQAHALLATLDAAAGRRAGEREGIGRAAEALQSAAARIEHEETRLAYLARPRRSEILRRAAALSPRALRPAEQASSIASNDATLSALYEITEIINSMDDLDTMLDRVLELGLAIVGAERGLIILLDETTGAQHVKAARELEDETVRDALAYSHSVVQEAAAGKVIVALDAHSDERFSKFKSVSLYSIKSLMCVPMKIRNKILGTVYVDSRLAGTPFDEQDLRFLEALANLAAGAVEKGRLHERLSSENVYLRREAGERNRYQNIIGKNVKMQAVYDLMEKVSASSLPVLIHGESGTGKELVARALHYSGPRRLKKFLSENVAAIPDSLLESEMFGHVRGAFTGADRDRKGLFEMADGGTLFMDEIGDMSLPMQSKLLRALQEGEIRPVGGKETRRVDVRIISASNKDLERMMKEGRFREDLYYRLHVVRVTLPALRERKEDIPLLVDHFLHKVSRESGGPPKRMELGALQLLLRYSWPGNVRELENEVQRLAVLCPAEVITQRDVMESGELFEKITRIEEKDTFAPLEELERRQIEKALMEAAGNRGRAAELLGISRATIFRKLRKFGISH